jgi:hypothetical protein
VGVILPISWPQPSHTQAASIKLSCRLSSVLSPRDLTPSSRTDQSIEKRLADPAALQVMPRYTVQGFIWWTTILSCGAKLVDSPIIIDKYKPTCSWRIIFPTYAMLPSVVEIIHTNFFFIAKREISATHFWMMRFIAFSALGSSVAFFVLARSLRPGTPSSDLAGYLGLAALEFCVSTSWACRTMWVSSIRSYTPVCRKPYRGDINCEAVAISPGPISRLHDSLSAEHPQERNTSEVKTPTKAEQFRLRIHGVSDPENICVSFGCTNQRSTATVPRSCWLAFTPQRSRLLARTVGQQFPRGIHRVFDVPHGSAHSFPGSPVCAYQEQPSAVRLVRAPSQTDDVATGTNRVNRRCTYNLVYIWLYIPWPALLIYTIRRQKPIAHRVLGRLTWAHLLAAYLIAALLLWCLGLYTTLSQTQRFSKLWKVGILIWGVGNATLLGFAGLGTAEFLWKAFRSRRVRIRPWEGVY